MICCYIKNYLLKLAYRNGVFDMNKEMRIGNLTLGDGNSKICVVINAHSKEELIEEAKKAYDSPAEIVEWRCDFFDDYEDMKAITDTIKAIKEEIKEKPLIFTFRSVNEGGFRNIGKPEFLLIYKTALLTKLVDIVDVELFVGDTMIKNVVKHAHVLNKYVMVSNHDFDSTPEKERLINRAKKMESVGADIVKLAMTPRSAKDVDVLIDACKECSEEMLMIGISMGELGKITRIDASSIGSALTYACLDEKVAPGQIPVKELKKLILDRKA